MRRKNCQIIAMESASENGGKIDKVFGLGARRKAHFWQSPITQRSQIRIGKVIAIAVKCEK